MALAGCATVSTVREVSEEGFRLTDRVYRQSLERYTRHQSLYQGLQRRLIWAATMEAPRFREIRSEAYASIRRLTESELEDLLAEEVRVGDDFLDFFIGFFTEQLVWNDLDAPNSIWRIDLLIDGVVVLRPIVIERIANPDPNVRALYPYLGAFSRAYRVRFPRKDELGQPLIRPEADTLTLRVSSAVAHGELSWPVALLEE